MTVQLSDAIREVLPSARADSRASTVLHLTSHTSPIGHEGLIASGAGLV